MGSFKATKNTVALKLPIPPKPFAPDRSTSLCRKTGSEEPSSVVASFAPVGRKIEFPTHSSFGTVMLTDSLLVRKGKALQGNCVLRCLEAPYPSGRALHGHNPGAKNASLGPVDSRDVARVQ